MSVSSYEAPKRNLADSQAKRVKMIFSVMASPNRIDILRILNSKGPLTYSELKSLAGFKSKKESGKFAYHLRKLLRQALVALNRSERRYTITNLGQLVLSLARQIEDRSVVESGKMHVRTSRQTIEDFLSHKITQSLSKEGGLPSGMAEKITEEVENRIYKHQPTYLTGPMIRDMANAALLEHGHEEYRNKLARVGMPVYDVGESLTKAESSGGVSSLIARMGKAVFSEYLMLSTLPKDVADSHLSGSMHITNLGFWSLLPDVIFANIGELVSDGIDLGGKMLDVSRAGSPKTLDEAMAVMSLALPLISKEASQEVVLDGLTAFLSKHSKSPAEIEPKLAAALSSTSASWQHDSSSTVVSFSLALGTDSKIIGAVMSAYAKYAKATPIPRIGLIIDYSKGKASDVSAAAAEIALLGGRISFSQGSSSESGLANPPSKGTGPMSIKMSSIAVNLPRLAFEANKDSTYFRARLAMLMTPAFAAMAQRKKDVSDLTRRGLNPLLAQNTQHMQRGSVSLMLNLVGLQEAVYSILGLQHDKKGRDTANKVIDTAIDRARKEGKALGDDIRICMTESDGTARFASLDGEKYGKNSVLRDLGEISYSEGVTIDAGKLAEMTDKSPEIAECAWLHKTLGGCLSIRLALQEGADAASVKKTIEKAASLLPSFRPHVRVPICGGCGYKDAKLADKCPQCRSPYIL